MTTLPLFNGLPEDQMAAIGKIAVEKNLPGGQSIFFEGDESNGFFVIANSRITVYKVSVDSTEQILHIFGPDQPFGEVSVFTGQKFPACAKAITQVRS